MNRICAFLMSVAGLAVGASAQELLWQRLGEQNALFVDAWNAFLDDVDGDGFDDLLHWAYNYGGQPPARQEIRTLSGRDGRFLRAYRTPVDYGYWALVSAGDVNGDGVRDYAAGMYLSEPPWDPNVVEVRSGRDEQVIWSTTGAFRSDFGWRLAGDLDLNGDGRPDLLISAPRENGAGAVHAHDHLGRRLYTIPIKAPSVGRLGGDLDGDGCEDFILGHWEPGLRGAASVYSGRTAQPLVTGVGEQVADGIGTGEVVGTGDVDGDGVLDFAASSAGTSPFPSLIRVFSGANGNPIHTFRAQNGAQLGRFLVSADLDRDGVQDLIAGSALCHPNGASCGSIWCYSLREGALLATVYPPGLPNSLTYFAWYGSVGRPRPGDVFPVFASPDRIDGSGLNPRGRAMLFRAAPAGVEGRGYTCNGSLGRAPRIGLRDRGAQGVRIHLSSAPPGAIGVLLLGASRTGLRVQPFEIDLDGLGFTGCWLQVPVEFGVPVVTGTTGLDSGYAFVDVPGPLNQGSGVTFHAQWLVLATGAQAPGALSDSLTMRR